METYDPRCDHKDMKFSLGMIFIDAAQCKDAIQRYAVVNGLPIKFTQTNKKQVEAKCIPECGWRIYASLVRIDSTFVGMVVSEEHKNCPTQIHNKQATAAWISNEYIERFRTRPKLDIKELMDGMNEKFSCQASVWKFYRAREQARLQVSGTTEEHYARLRSYVAELKRVYPEGRYELRLSVFKSFYIGLSALKKGFIEGCRSIIGFDGCFLEAGVGGVFSRCMGCSGCGKPRKLDLVS